jgi:peptidoglycan hydrolase-like protein with peptidoglycan-binding domain
MTKSGFIVPLWFFLASGCALYDGLEMTSEQQPVAAPVAENETTAAVELIGPAPPPETSVPRNFSKEDIRAMQLRLRDLGFNPGPVDGAPGAKTKAAFTRFQIGCSKIKPFMENSFEAPSRQETETIQARLRDAGFNPGRVDGIFGNRTRSVLAHLKAGCPMATDFAEMLERQIGATDKRATASRTLENKSTKLQPATTAEHSDATKQTAAPAISARPQEDIRILQVRLRDAGFDPGPFDGVMGPKTKAALHQYQVMQRENNGKVPVISGISHY